MRIFHNCSILTMDEQRNYFKDGVLIEDQGKIVAVGEKGLIDERTKGKRVNMQGKLLMPGLINAHVHLAQALIRGQADDMELDPWLFERIWPFQAALDKENFLKGARLAMLEMMLSGTTTFVESMIIRYGLEELAEEVEKIGMRAMLSKVLMDPMPGSLLPENLTEGFSDSLDEAIACKNNRAKDSLVEIWLGPRWTGMYSPVLLDKVREAMDEYGFKTTIHYAESPEDVEKIKQDVGLSPLGLMKGKGLLDREVLLIHGTHLPEEDYIYLKDSIAGLVHCPVSAMKVAMGYANIPKIKELGAKVSLGNDAGACNNTHDLFREMRTMALLHKYENASPAVMSARDCLETATIGGAKCLYLEDRIGSLEKGRDADFITLDMNKAHLQPCLDPVAALVYSANGSDVRDVFVQGRQLVANGESLVFDQEKVIYEANKAFLATAEKAGMEIIYGK